MPTASKTWTWDSSTEDWSLTTATRVTNDGSPNNGCLYCTASGKNLNVYGYADLTTGTWASLFGISTGCTVTDVQVTDGSYGPRTKSEMTGTAYWPSFRIYINDGGDQSIYSRQNGSTGWITTNPAGTNRTLTTPQSASSTVDLRLEINPSTGNDKYAVSSGWLDYLTITITYTPPTHEITLATESTSSVAVVGSVTEAPTYREVTLALESTTSATIGAAISLVGTASNDASTGTAVSVTHGLTIESGDVVIAAVHANGDLNTTSDNNGSYPFTSVYTMDNYDSARLMIFSRVAGASEPSSYNFTIATSGRWAIVVRVYRNVDSGSIWDVTPSASTFGEAIGSTSTVIPSMTITSAGSCGLVVIGDDYSPTTNSFTNIDNSYANQKEEAGQQLLSTWDRLGMSSGSSGSTTVTSNTVGYTTGVQGALKGGPGVGKTSVPTREITLALEATSSSTIGPPAGPRGTLLEDFSDTGEWTTGGTVTLDYDSTHTREGASQHVRMNLTASTTGAISKTITSVNLTDTTIEVWYYIDVDVYSTFQQNFDLRLGTNASNYYQRTNHGGKSRPGWNVMRVTTVDIGDGRTYPYGCFETVQGSPNWAAITWIQILFTPEADDDLKLTLCTLRIGAKGPRAAFIMTHDDGDESVYTVARSIMNARGIHTTAYVNSNTIGNTGKLTNAMLQTLASEGHYIGSHFADHTDMTTLTQQQVTDGCNEGQQEIDAIVAGHGRHGAYPYGAVNNTVIAGVNAASNQTTWAYTGVTNTDVEEATLNPYSISRQSDLEGDDPDYYEQAIEVAILTGEAYLALIHYPGTSVTTEYFTALCEYAAVTQEMWCPNIDEWWEYGIGVGVGKIDATWEITLGLESTSAVTAVGSKTAAQTTHEVTLGLESTSSAAAVGSKTDATWEVTLSLESASAVTAAGSQVHATHELVLALESLSSVAVAPLVSHAIHEIILALESTTSAAAAGSIVHAAHEIVLASESTSSVVVAASKTEATYEVTLALESTSSVTAAGSLTHAAHEVALALQSTTAVTVLASQLHATFEVSLSAESTSSVVVTGAKSGTQEIDLALEATTAVTVAASQTHAVHEVGLSLEAISSVVASGSITHATREVALALESTSSVATVASKVDATWEVVLAKESTTSVVALGSKVEAVWDVVLALQATTNVAAAGYKTDATWEIVLACESTSAVTVVGSQTTAAYEVVLAVESTTAVTVAAQQTHATFELELALESTTAVTAVGSVTGSGWTTFEVVLALESRSAIYVVPAAIREVVLALQSTSTVIVRARVIKWYQDVLPNAYTGFRRLPPLYFRRLGSRKGER